MTKDEKLEITRKEENRLFEIIKQNLPKASKLIDNAKEKQPFKVGNKEFYISKYCANFRLDEVGAGMVDDGGKKNLAYSLAREMAYMDLGIKK